MSSTPMTADQWKRQLKKFGVPYRELATFKDPNSGRDDETGLRFGPVHGGMIHHTGSDTPDITNRVLIATGRSDLPGPLAHCGLNDDGTVDLHTTGRANHAGGGDYKVLDAVITESYGDYPPPTHQHQGSPLSVDGNDYFYGLESYYYKNLTPEAYASMVGWGAAICNFHGWSAKSMIGHKEWSDWKPDPNLVDMKVYRRAVDRLLEQQTVPTTLSKKTLKNVQTAIQLNKEYVAALKAIKNPQARSEALGMIVALRRQRKALKSQLV